MPLTSPKIKINIRVNFDIKFKEPPRVKIHVPNTAAIIEVQKEFFSLSTHVNPITTWDLKVEYQADFKPYNITIPLQFCPACFVPFSDWQEIHTAGFTPQGQVAPAIPIGFCPACGNTFISRKNLKFLQKGKESNIIIPTGIVVGRK